MVVAPQANAHSTLVDWLLLKYFSLIGCRMQRLFLSPLGSLSSDWSVWAFKCVTYAFFDRFFSRPSICACGAKNKKTGKIPLPGGSISKFLCIPSSHHRVVYHARIMINFICFKKFVGSDLTQAKIWFCFGRNTMNEFWADVFRVLMCFDIARAIVWKKWNC